MKTYTLEQVKKAFWDTFHKNGEFFFNYLGSDEDNEGSTQLEWEYFIENLKNKRGVA